MFVFCLLRAATLMAVTSPTVPGRVGSSVSSQLPLSTSSEKGCMGAA